MDPEVKDTGNQKEKLVKTLPASGPSRATVPDTFCPVVGVSASQTCEFGIYADPPSNETRTHSLPGLFSPLILIRGLSRGTT